MDPWNIIIPGGEASARSSSSSGTQAQEVGLCVREATTRKSKERERDKKT